MRILWYNWRDIKNPEAGGAEVFTHEVCKRLVKQNGVESVTIFAASFEGAFAEEQIDGVRIVRRGGKYSVYSEAKKFYRRNKDHFDIVVDEINTKPFHTPSFVHDKPIVALIHQLAREFWFYETHFPINVIGYLFLENYWLRKYRDTPTITVSKSSKEDLMRLGFKHVTIVPEGINFSPFERLHEKEAKPTVLFVGRLKKAKRPEEALRAFKVIKDEIPDARFWIVGDGYMREQLKTMADEMFTGSSDITLYGRQDTAKKLELMSKAHVLLVPGVREGWGLVVTEASAMGTPAVAYDVPGLRDSVIDGTTGTLVHSGDHVAMAIEAIDLLRDHIKRKTYSKNGLQNAKQYDWNNTSDRLGEVLRQTLAKWPRPIEGAMISHIS
ncbi:MAG: glycosyltransferase involved in cell wall biosynthesis [Candidatus Nitrosomirales archaeon]|jgi:glycosyltransferase involved in cell wall biosynthesis